MFYDLVMKNSKRNRKENGLFFVSLIVAIVSFYIILSLEKQDVIVFLKTMESDALNKLFLLIPVLYGFSLFILFFLVYFAGKYQLERRSKELGMYMLLGMKRKKLLLMLFAEEIWNSIISLAIGIPIAIFISEMISLITAKVVGMGIIGHSFTFSIVAVLGTIVGYFIIRLIAITILSGKFTNKEIMELLSDSQKEKGREVKKGWATLQLVIGIILLVVAFYMAISGEAWQQIKYFAPTVVGGLLGIFLVFRGAGVLFELILSRKMNKNGLGMFSFRQLQESVFLKPNLLAISSILVIVALSCASYGISVGTIFNNKEEHIMDYTFEEEFDTLTSQFKSLGIDKYMDKIVPMEIGMFYPEDESLKVSVEDLINKAKAENDTEFNQMIINNLQYVESPYLISLDSYNELLKLKGEAPIQLKDNEIALYDDPEFASPEKIQLFNSILEKNSTVKFGEEVYKLSNKYYHDSVVTDRLITISYGFIVPNEVFEKYTKKDNISTYWNITLDNEFVKEEGLMQAIAIVNEKLGTTDMYYDSYLQNMGRELFFSVAGSYTTIYLAVIFLIIANTVMGVQFLMHQQKTQRRYQSLTYLGANYKMMKKSGRNQVAWYFALPLTVASVCSVFAVRALYSGVLTVAMKSEIITLMKASIPVIVAVIMVELIYIKIVMKNSDRNILNIMEIKREDN